MPTTPPEDPVIGELRGAIGHLHLLGSKGGPDAIAAHLAASGVHNRPAGLRSENCPLAQYLRKMIGRKVIVDGYRIAVRGVVEPGIVGRVYTGRVLSAFILAVDSGRYDRDLHPKPADQ